jgi:hypothetical protein
MVTDIEERIQRFNKTLDTEYPDGAGRFPWSGSVTVTVTCGFRCIEEKRYRNSR